MHGRYDDALFQKSRPLYIFYHYWLSLYWIYWYKRLLVTRFASHSNGHSCKSVSGDCLLHYSDVSISPTMPRPCATMVLPFWKSARLFLQRNKTMALRIAAQGILKTRLAAQRPLWMATSVRAESTLNTGEVLEDPQIGDYPNLPRYSAQTRGPYGWWDPQDKRNFGETVSIDKLEVDKASLTIDLLFSSCTKKMKSLAYGHLIYFAMTHGWLWVNLVFFQLL